MDMKSASSSLAVKTVATSVKKSVSMPESMWDYVSAKSRSQGHDNASRIIQEAVDRMRNPKKYRKPLRKVEAVA